MARPRTLPDSQVFDTVIALLALRGEKGVTFATVSQRTGLAGASLVQRYGGLDGMMSSALDWAWTRMEAALTEAEATPPDAQRVSAADLLRGIEARLEDLPVSAIMAASQRDATLREKAESWRARVLAALDGRSGDASLLFASWLGQWLWSPFGGQDEVLSDLTQLLPPSNPRG